MPRTILVAPPTQIGLTYAGDVYVCDETTTRYNIQQKKREYFHIFLLFRTSILCHVLYNGDTSSSATWTGRYLLIIFNYF